jgi:hypothetical protein
MPAMPKEYASLARRPFLAPVWLGAALALLLALLAVWVLRAASTTLVLIANVGATAGGIETYCARPAPAPGIDAVLVAGPAAAALARCRGAPVTWLDATAPGGVRGHVLKYHRGGQVLVLATPERFRAAVAEFLDGTDMGIDAAATAYVVAYPRFSRPALLAWPLS